MSDSWTLVKEGFDPNSLLHRETIFTIGNGYLCTRGAFEEAYPGDRRATLVHGVFDYAPIVRTELANAPDWLPLDLVIDGEPFSLATGAVDAFEQRLDLSTGTLTRTLRWRSPLGRLVALRFERFASLADEHLLMLRCTVTLETGGSVQVRCGLNGYATTDFDRGSYRLQHWHLLEQGDRDGSTYLVTRTSTTDVVLAAAMRVVVAGGEVTADEMWDQPMLPSRVISLDAAPGEPLVIEKSVSIYTSRDMPAAELVGAACDRVLVTRGWAAALAEQAHAWHDEWSRVDVTIEGDDDAQLAIRFNLFQMVIAAPRHDDRVNIGAKTLSGFGYRGHAFWDTEIFMLPLFTFTLPSVARNLLTYRWRHLPGARQKARAGGYEGAWFPWESADTGEEVTPTWVPHYADVTRMVRIWTGDIEIHISADVAYAAFQYWRVTGDDGWLVEKGAELILDTAKFWASRAEWHPSGETGRYEYRDVIGPDEYHEHVDNNFYTNRMAQWNLRTALYVLEWLGQRVPAKAEQLATELDLSAERIQHWRHVIDALYMPMQPDGLIEQFEGYFRLPEVDATALQLLGKSFQQTLGIAGANQMQGIKQPDVLMLLYLLRSEYSDAVVDVNYRYYTPRTDHAYGSSLGPAITAIMACDVGDPDEAYEHFIRAAHADMYDVRGNADDGIHGASAAGTWQAIAFGFAGLRLTPRGWQITPRLPRHWKRLAFKFVYRGEPQSVDIRPD